MSSLPRPEDGETMTATNHTNLDLAQLAERVTALGTVVLRGDVDRWVRSLDAAGHERRMELAASQDDPSLVELASLVECYGAPLVLAAIGRTAARSRRESLGLGGAS
jgi:hypothetical protein